MQIKIKKLDNTAHDPIRATAGSGAYDLVATSRTELPDGRIKYGTGLAVEIPEGYCGKLHPRSSIYKTGLVMANGVGLIDSDYRGEICAIFYRLKGGEKYVPGDRVCQLIIEKNIDVSYEEVEELTETKRGEGGFGSTGK